MVATAIGGDDIKALREQVAQLKLDDKPAWINNQQDWPDVWGAPQTLFGVFGTTWYHKLLLPGVDDFVRRYQSPVEGRADPCSWKRFRQRLHVHEGGAERDRASAGSTNNIAIIKQLEQSAYPPPTACSITAPIHESEHTPLRSRRSIWRDSRSRSTSPTCSRS